MNETLKFSFSWRIFCIEIRLYLLCLRRDCDTKNRKSGSSFSLKMQLSFRQELILQVVLRFQRYMLKWFSREIIIYSSIRVIHFLTVRDKKTVKMPWSSIGVKVRSLSNTCFLAIGSLKRVLTNSWIFNICPSWWMTERLEFWKCDKGETNKLLYGCDSMNSDTVTVNISGMTINAKSLMYFASLNMQSCLLLVTQRTWWPTCAKFAAMAKPHPQGISPFHF